MKQKYTLQELRKEKYIGYVHVNNRSEIYYFNFVQWDKLVELFTGYETPLDEKCDLTFSPCSLSGNPLYDPESKEGNENGPVVEEPLPSWASSLVPKDRIISGQQVLTKDGRVTGNGVIFKIDVRQISNDPEIWHTIFHIITDAGNIIRLTQRELFDQFYLGEFHMIEYPGDPNGTKLDYYED